MNPDIVEVVAADREAAANLVRVSCHSSMKVAAEALATPILDGNADDGNMVQAFARHRIAAITAVRPAILEEVVAIAYDAITDGELAREVATAIRAAGRDGA